MDAATIAIVLGCFVAASFLKGVTGLGFSTICMGLLAHVLDVKTAIALVILPSLLTNALVMRQAGNFGPVFRRFRFMFLCTVPGLLLGLWGLTVMGGPQGRLALGAVLCAYGAWGLTARGRTRPLPAPTEQRLMAPTGFATGVVNGLTGSQIMPILPYLMALDLDKDGLVQAINTSFTISSLIMLAGLGGLGVVTPTTLAVSLAGILPVTLCIHLGGRVRRAIPERAFRRMVLVLLVVLGVLMILRALA